MNIIERIDSPCEYVEVAQTALIACQYLYLWLFAGPVMPIRYIRWQS